MAMFYIRNRLSQHDEDNTQYMLITHVYHIYSEIKPKQYIWN